MLTLEAGPKAKTSGKAEAKANTKANAETEAEQNIKAKTITGDHRK